MLLKSSQTCRAGDGGRSVAATRPRAAVVLAVMLFLTAACGSTVQMRSGTAAAGSDLGGTGSSAVTPDTSGQIPSAGTIGGAGATGGSASSGSLAPAAGSGVVSGSGGTSGVVGSGSSGAGTGSSSTGTSTGPSASRTGPVKVGFLAVDYVSGPKLGAAGDSQKADSNSYVRALVATLNKSGGLDGRQIEPYYYLFDGASSDYGTAAQAACAYFTEDKKVEIVGVYALAYPAFSKCLADAGVAEFNSSPFTRSRFQTKTFPGILDPVGLGADRGAIAVIDGLFRTGWLTKKDKVGVFVASCPEFLQTYQNVVVPRLKGLGIAVEDVTFNCPTGFSSVGDISASAQSAGLKMHSDGVTKVMYLTYYENLVNAFFATNADGQGWKPGYLLSTNAGVNQTRANLPKGQLPQMKGVGWNPVTDLYLSRPPTTPARAECVRSAGAQSPTNGAEAMQLYSSCDLLFLMRAVLTQTHGVTSFATVLKGLEGLRGYTAVTSFGPTAFGPGAHDGVAVGSVYSYKASCSCVTYDDKQPHPIP